ncbi:Sodium:neurotransmitter symporter family protein [Vibrio thalassae]|uniref:Sodium:neurotransmitter symporter family protein n=1 Tax=Vibrio thalassae TaxID=1243014 RepID=A0A240EEF8_9VIBR|nr:Sodium:neurotransmitter symporter family protein [Vibrio thalassae]
MAYENGGGAFFIPYLFAMITAGIPFMILEFSMGQKYRGSAPVTLARINPKFEWLGWFQVGVAATIAVYYVAVIGWAMTYAAIAGGVKSGIERAAKIMMPILFIMVLLLIGRTIFLPGALDGVNYMFEPDFSKIWDVKVWAAAYGQIFFTLSIGFAIMLVYSIYLPEKSDITNNAFMTVLINFGFSILAGIMIFSVLGYMAQEQGKPLTEVVSAGVGLAFVTLPAAINLLPAPYILGPLFFFALVIAGLSSHISIMEAVTSAVIDKLKWRRNKAATIICGTGFIISMAFATNGGLLLLDLVDHFANNVGIIVGCLVEIILMAWLLKIADVREYVNQISDFTIGTWFDVCLRFITPLILIVIVATKFKALLTEGYGGYAHSDIMILGWGLMGLLVVIGIVLNLTSKKEA